MPLSLRHLERFELGTRYPMVIDRIRGLLTSGALKHKRVAFLVDKTGVGASVVDSLVQAGLSPIAVTIHGGSAVSRDEHGYRVPKRDPVSAVQVLLQNGCLRKAEGLPLKERMQHGALWQENGLVFPSSVGTPLSGCNLNRTFKGTLQRAGLPKSTRFHDLRHTCATLLLRQGVNPKFVQELLGHADISLTLNTYSHVLPDMGDAAAGGMDAALG